MNRTWCLAMLPVVVASAAHAQSVAGDWQGTLKDGSTDLKTVLHIVSGGGVLKATIDSPDQGAYAIPITSVSFKDLKLTWSSDALGATYEGTLSPQGDSIQGMFTQRGQTVALDFKRITGPPVQPSDIDGEWRGILEAGPTRLHIALHFINTADGLNATLDSLDQGAMAIPATVERKGDSLKLVFKALGATYEAKIKSDRSAISGTFTQGATPMALDLTRANPAAQAKRPQNPVKPYPYREEDVVYDNPSAPGVRLAATFTIPKGQGPFPAVLLITGSGPQDRDESLLGHKPFLVLSDFLTRHGIAVLRADDRGTAKSTGNFAAATSADFATDAEAGVAWLKTRAEANHARIGLIGHSEGGSIAPMVAARNHDVAFIVMLAGSGVSGEDMMVAQVMALNEGGGMSRADALKTGEMERTILKVVESEPDPVKLREKLAAYIPQEQLNREVAALGLPWYRSMLRYNPAADLRKLTCPVLAINGSKDTQVVAKQNLPAIREALEAAGNKHFEVVEMPGLNHLLQTAKTGSPSEYEDIEETMSPAVLEKIANWIQGLK